MGGNTSKGVTYTDAGKVETCVFCRIIEGTETTKTFYEDESCVAFYPRDRCAKSHILVVPKEHIKTADTLMSMGSEGMTLLNHMEEVGLQLLRQEEGGEEAKIEDLQFSFHVPPYNSMFGLKYSLSLFLDVVLCIDL